MTLPLSPEELKAYNNIPCTPVSQKLGDTIDALIGGGGGGPNINFKATPSYGSGFAASDTLVLPAGVITPGTQVVLIGYSATMFNNSSTSQAPIVNMENTSTATVLTSFNCFSPGLSQSVVDSVTDAPGGGLGPGTYMDAGFNPITGPSVVYSDSYLFSGFYILHVNYRTEGEFFVGGCERPHIVRFPGSCRASVVVAPIP